MPLRRTSAALLYTRSLSKATISPSSQSSSTPSSPCRPSPSPDLTLSVSRAQIRRSKKAAELANKSSKTKNVHSWTTDLSPKTSFDLGFALNDDKAYDQELDDAFPALSHDMKPEEIAPPNDRPRVQLADLVISKKPRRKIQDGDFEFVPPVRSVIVLDDNTTPEIDFDEPWEHIYGTDDNRTSEPSYADIASLN